MRLPNAAADRPLPRTAPSTPRIELRVDADLRACAWLRGDMAGLMAEHEGQLGLVVHQPHQLAGDVDIAAGHREGILDRAC